MINTCELFINVVKDTKLKLLARALTKRYAVSLPPWRWWSVDIKTVGELIVSKSFLLSKGNWVNPYICLTNNQIVGISEPSLQEGTDIQYLIKGKQTARGVVIYAGRRECKKRMSLCNGVNRDLNVILPEKGADLQLVSHGEINQGNFPLNQKETVTVFLLNRKAQLPSSSIPRRRLA